MDRAVQPPGVTHFDWRTGTPEEFARVLFDRPIAETESAKDAIVGDGDLEPNCGDEAFVRLCTGLFRAFGKLTATYTDEQVEQGLWMVGGNPYFLVLFHLADAGLPVEVAVDCIRASYHLYSDYLAPRRAWRHAAPLYMWWDESWRNASSGPGAPRPEVVNAVFETLIRILQLDDDECRNAALHGLHHLEEDMGGVALNAALDGIEERLGVELSENQRGQLNAVRSGFHPSGARDG